MTTETLSKIDRTVTMHAQWALELPMCGPGFEIDQIGDERFYRIRGCTIVVNTEMPMTVKVVDDSGIELELDTLASDLNRIAAQ